MKSLLQRYLVVLLLGIQTVCVAQDSKIARAIFTTGIVEREPIDQILQVNNKVPSVFFFTDLRHFEGQMIIHKWVYKDKVESIVKFKVKGPRWRVFSRKDIEPEQLGKWTVVIQDEFGNSLKASVFRLVDKVEQQIVLPISK